MCHGFGGIFTALAVIKHLTVLRRTKVMTEIRVFSKIVRSLKRQLVKCF